MDRREDGDTKGIYCSCVVSYLFPLLSLMSPWLKPSQVIRHRGKPTEALKRAGWWSASGFMPLRLLLQR